MRLWIDLVNLPHIRLFSRLLRSHEDEIEDVLISCRRLNFLPELASFLLPKYSEKMKVVGSHGISLADKLSKHLERILSLTKIVSEFSQDVAASKASPELARVAFGLGIPSVNLNDNDLSIHVSKLIFPLSQTIVVPEAFPDEVLAATGAVSRVRKFKGVAEVAHVLDYFENAKEPETKSLEEPYIVARPAPVGASYLREENPSPSFERALIALVERIPRLKIYLFPREGFPISEKLRDHITLIRNPRDSLALVSGAVAFLGASGTMTREAALLGVPSISMFPSPREPCVTQLLIDKGLVIKLMEPERVAEVVARYIEDENARKSLKRRAIAFLDESEDPSEVLWEEIMRLSHRP